MRSIQGNAISLENGYYKIKLGNGSIHIFKSERKALKYQVKVNSFLTQIAYNYNQLFSDLSVLYRELWTYFYNTKNTDKGSPLFNESIIKSNLQGIDELLHLLTTSPSRQNSFYRIYRDFELIHEYFINVCIQLQNVTANKSIVFIQHRLNTFVHLSHTYQSEISIFSTKANAHTIEIDRLAASIKTSLDYSQTA